MSDLDFHGLRDAAGRAAQPEFATVRERARRLRARRRAATGGSALVVTALLSVTGYVVTADHSGSLSVSQAATGIAWPTVPAPVPTPKRTSPAPTISGVPMAVPPRVRWVGAGDAQHLYAVVAACGDCPQALMASDDGGATWTERPNFPASDWRQFELTAGAAGANAASTLVLAKSPTLADAVSRTKEAVSPDAPAIQRVMSRDGGATWQVLRSTDDRLPTVPVGGVAIQWRTTASGTTLQAVDPAAATIRPLATQPPLRDFGLAAVPDSAGIWVEGHDPATGKPAVAISRDRGASWTASVFGDEPSAPTPSGGRPAGTMYRPSVATADGVTAYAVFVRGAADIRVYRSTDGGAKWQLTSSGRQLGGAPLAGPEAWVTADGSHVVAVTIDGYYAVVASRDGRDYEPVSLAGLPNVDRLPIVIDAAHYLYQSGDHIFRSGDGRNWQALPVPGT